MKVNQSILALVAVLFGLATIFAGTRVLLGYDPGYIVFRPLLIFNTAMGIVYVVAGFLAWHIPRQGMYLAATIFILNLVVLAAIYFLYTEGNSIAVESLRAMTVRTVVWFALFVGLGWLNRRKNMR